MGGSRSPTQQLFNEGRNQKILYVCERSDTGLSVGIPSRLGLMALERSQSAYLAWNSRNSFWNADPEDGCEFIRFEYI